MTAAARGLTPRAGGRPSRRIDALTGDNRQLRVLVVGARFGAETIVPAIRNGPSSTVCGILSGSANSARRVAAKLGIEAAFARDVDTALDVLRPDLVCVASPVDCHRDHALAALRAGCHLVCEKPLARNHGEANDIVAAWRNSGLVGACDFEFRYVPAISYLRELVGALRAGDVERLRLRWHTQMFSPGSKRPWSWLCDADRGGGVLLALGSHLIDLATWLTGRRAETVGAARLSRSAASRRDPSGVERAVTADDAARFTVTLEGDVRAEIDVSWASLEPDFSIVVEGDLGRLELDRADRLTVTLDGRDPERLEVPAGHRIRRYGHRNLDCFSALYRRVATSILTNGTVDHPTLEDGLAVQRVLDQVRAVAPPDRH